MNYKLALQLKEAGFPQELYSNSCFLALGKTIGKRGEEWMIWTGMETPIGQKWYKVPTLSELIEACGYGFYTLTFVPTEKKYYAIMSAEAKKTNKGNIAFSSEEPEEAVAKLWLELHKK